MDSNSSCVGKTVRVHEIRISLLLTNVHCFPIYVRSTITSFVQMDWYCTLCKVSCSWFHTKNLILVISVIYILTNTIIGYTYVSTHVSSFWTFYVFEVNVQWIMSWTFITCFNTCIRCMSLLSQYIDTNRNSMVLLMAKMKSTLFDFRKGTSSIPVAIVSILTTAWHSRN